MKTTSRPCATGDDRLCLGRGLLLETFVGSLAAEAAVGAMVVVAVLPLAQLVVEDLGVVDDDARQEPLELLVVDPVRACGLPVQPRCTGVYVGVTDAFVEDVEVEGRLRVWIVHRDAPRLIGWRCVGTHRPCLTALL